MPGFSYTPLLGTAVIARKPKAPRHAKQAKPIKTRLGYQQPLPLSLGEPAREYVLKTNPTTNK